MVPFQVPVKTDALGRDDDDDEQHAAKRAKTAPAKKMSLAAMLPAPKNSGKGLGGGGGGSVLGRGNSGAGMAGGDGGGRLGAGGGAGGAMVDLGGETSINALDAPTARMPEASAGPVEHASAIHPSQMYAVDESGQYMYHQYAQHYGHDYGAGGPVPEGQQGTMAELSSAAQVAPDGVFDVDHMLSRAMQVERKRAAQATGRGAIPGVKELNMESLRAGTRGALDDKTSMTGLAFGDEYREKLNREAGAKPSMVHKQKNQIGTLLYNAKQKEMDIMNGRLAGVSHKAMAKQKYGW